MTKVVWRKIYVRLVLGLAAAIALFAVIFVAAVELTPFDQAKLTRVSQPSVVYARDGSVYMTIAAKGSDDLTYDKIPKQLRDAIVAIEDHNYWDNSSIDIRGLLRAGLVDLWTGNLAQGGSTIQEQLAKIVYLNDKKTFTRKFQQIVLGVQINRHFTKQEILAMYLNRVFLGENCVGVEEAAYRYFGIDLRQDPGALTLDQAALLAGLPQAPSAYDPLQHPEAAKRRRNQVLEAMAKYGYITEAQARQAEAKPVAVSYHSLPWDAWDTHPLFTNFLFDNAQQMNISQEELLQGGLKIYTTIDPKVQSAVDRVFWSTNYNNDFPGPTSGTVVEGAALFVDPATGGVLGAAGSRRQDYVYLGKDRVYSMRPPGSSIKPVLEYGAAIESGQWGPDSILDNTPRDFGGGYVPRNDDPNAPPRLTLQRALETSQNVASVWLLKQIGINTGADFAQRLGIPLTDDDRRHLGIAIGDITNGVSPWIMAQAYQPFDNKGIQVSMHLITRIVNSAGDTIYQYQPAAKRVMSERTASVMTQLLQGVVLNGTGTPAQVPGWGVAGKTGTVQYDPQLNGAHQHWISTAWFDGYTPNMVGSIYIGYDYTTPEHHLSDVPHYTSWYCAKLFGDIVQLATAGEPPQQFNVGPVQPAQPQQPPVANFNAAWDSNINALMLTWTSPLAGQANFVIERAGPYPPGQANPQPSDFVTLGQSNQTSYEDTAIQPGMTYVYQVQAVDPATGQRYTPAVTLTVTISASAPGDAGFGNSPGLDNGSTPPDGGTANGAGPPAGNGAGTGSGGGQPANASGGGSNNSADNSNPIG